MVLDEYRSEADKYLTTMAEPMRGINPNTLSILAFLFAVIAGIFFYMTNFDFLIPKETFLLFAMIFIGLNAIFDALDGKVARLNGKASVKGDYLDHVLDRYADVFIIGGIMLSPYCREIIGLLAILGIIFASYMGTQAQAVGVGRTYKGILGRADRLAILIITPLIQYLLIISNYPYIVLWDYKITFIEVVMIYFAIAGNVTAVQRFATTWEDLSKV